MKQLGREAYSTLARRTLSGYIPDDDLPRRIHMFSPTEAVTLTIQLAALPLVLVMLRSSSIPGRSWFGAAYACLLLSNTCTVTEDFFWPVVCDTIEHLSMAVFALLFLRGVWVFLRDHPASEG